MDFLDQDITYSKTFKNLSTKGNFKKKITSKKGRLEKVMSKKRICQFFITKLI